MTGRSTRAATVLGTVAALALGVLAARAETVPPLPGGTDPCAGFPPLIPHEIHDESRVRTWCTAAAEAGRARRGTTLGGDLLLSAAWALDRRAGDGAAALGLFAEAAQAYPVERSPAGRIAAFLEVARLQRLAGDPAALRRTIETVKRLGARGPPVDAEGVESLRWGVIENRLLLVLPRLETDLLEVEGRLADAAALLESFADRYAREFDTSGTWARAARLRARAGDVDQAVADVDRAIAQNTSERFAADWSFWRLHLLHDCLDAEAAIPIQTSWPGEDFTRDLHACLYGLRGNPHVGPWLLSVASTALASGENEMALDLYLTALADRAFVDAAQGRPLLWRGLLAGFSVALRLERFDDAERILGAVDRIGGIPLEEMDGYRVSLAEARAEAAEGSEPRLLEALDEPTEAPLPDPPPSPGRGRLNLPPEEEGGAEATRHRPERRDAADRGDPPAWPAPVLGAAAFLLLTFLVLRRGRR